ncbi:Kinesin-like protein [Quillaja saponaria]|uniref:Kinesin-like protein n=1 Tax=Quillaja saponaria TaxID=32244 RepID=A0AAD7P7Q3_QUISA|nr:Kinesin-like protein [Quillaja saponaria]KAJ7944924.1 Kinesin-like protein [Quillaja saponaria]
MNFQLERHKWENMEAENSNGFHDGGVYRIESIEGMVEGSQLSSLIKWINGMLPHINLPLEASEEELRVWLANGSVLYSILDKLIPGSVEVRGGSDLASLKRFLAVMDELGLPSFEQSDLEKGSMIPVLQCLETLRAHCTFNVGQENIQSYSTKRLELSEVGSVERTDCSVGDTLMCGEHFVENGEARTYKSSDLEDDHGLQGPVLSDPSAVSLHHTGHKAHEMFQMNQGSYGDLSDDKVMELIKSNILDNASTQSLFIMVHRILGDTFDRKNGDITHTVGYLLSKILQMIERRFSNQAESLKNQSNHFKAREAKYQSRISVLETLAMGTTEENEVVAGQLQKLKFEKTKLEEKKKLEEQDVVRLKKEKDHSEFEISTLKQELEMAKKTHEEHYLQLEVHASGAKIEYEKKLKELELFIAGLRKKVKELEAYSESKSRRWKNKEHTYKNFINYQFGAFQELRAALEFMKHEVLMTKRSYSKEFNYLGVKLKVLAEAAENYHAVLTENRKLYNEVQDLKGNIRVYCRIRPFLQGQSQNHTTIEYMGDNGELIVTNPLKQGKESRKLFKFNKVFSPATTQEEVFLDTRPLIRSVLDGYNVCIFAYGQTGSGKTYTMSGPSLSSKENWGVNYRALHDLFQISQSRRSSIFYEVGVQMVEIYNEQVRDLLSSGGSQKRLGIWNTAQPNGLAVPDASMHPVKSMVDVLELMNVGLTNRATGATALNERSSRSHSVLTVHVRGTDLETSALLRGCLHLVDLAGSERVDRSEATGDRLREAQHINKSLSALGDVISALAQKSSHVPYRNSKLTQLLQSSLGGQAKTLMFVQLNPDVASYSETVSTLKFAERVSGVELGAARSNKEGKDVREFMDQVAYLKDTVAKKDEEIERLQLDKANLIGAKRGMSSLHYGSSSPRRHSIGTPEQSRRLSGASGSGHGEKAASDMDNCSEYSDKHSEAGSHQSMDDLKNNKQFFQSKLAGRDLSQNLTEDIDLLGFGDVDSDERLSDISDGGLSMGTETTDGSICSVVEYTLFPEVAKQAETTPPKSLTAEVIPAENTERSSVPSKIPRASSVSKKPVQTKSSRLPLNRSSSKVISSARKTAAGSSSSVKPLKPWQ